jgi:putative hydrolase of the HAD superfamily
VKLLISAVTFDFWNTLYELPIKGSSSRQRALKFTHLFKQTGTSVASEELHRVLEECWTYADHCQRVEEYDITPSGHVDYILENLKIKASPELRQAVYDTYTRALEDNPPIVREGVREVLPVLASSCRLAVICNTGGTPGVILREFMEKDGILDYFNFLVFSDEVGWAKPNIHIFQHALTNIGCIPQQAAHIGDDPITDVMGAKRAGMKAVWLAPHATSPLPECDYHVRSVTELLNIIEDR